MNVLEFTKIASVVKDTYRALTCEFCGAETMSGTGMAFCSNCESMISTDRKNIEARDPQLLEALDSIRDSVLNGKFDEASAIYDQILLQKPSPQLFYAKGIMLLEQSNFLISQVNYSREGFMDKNAEIRDKGNMLVSDAKKFIAKSLFQSRKELAAAGDKASILYRIMLCELKMSNLRAANDCLIRMPKDHKDKEIVDYATVLMLTSTGNYKDAITPCVALFEKRGFPVNALYYLAFNLFKTGDLNGAKRILGSSSSLIEDQKMDYLMEAMMSTVTI